eukprot:1637392-Ditylum_brightwellii.AAC.1
MVIGTPIQSATSKKITPLWRLQTSPQISKPTIPMLSPRVNRHKMPNVIPFDEDNLGHLPPPKPHLILVPTPKGGSFYIPPEEII